MISPRTPDLTIARKRLVKAPKVYFRDSGLVHALLDIRAARDLADHSACSASWEAWVIEQILPPAAPGSSGSFYRTSAGTEIDLILERPGRPPLAFEAKRTTSPGVTKGLRVALDDLGIKQAYVVCPVEERFRLAPRIEVLPVGALAQVL